MALPRSRLLRPIIGHCLALEDGAGQAPRAGESDGHCVAELRGDEASRRSMPLVVLKGRVIAVRDRREKASPLSEVGWLSCSNPDRSWIFARSQSRHAGLTRIPRSNRWSQASSFYRQGQGYKPAGCAVLRGCWPSPSQRGFGEQDPPLPWISKRHISSV